VATVVGARVVSSSSETFVLDAGAKALTKDRAEYLGGFGLMPDYPDAVVERLYDYHAVVRAPSGGSRPAVGELVAVVPNHVCPVVDLVDSFVVLDADGSWQRWPVDARGKSG
jgi:D-serine deaminase-like pyridoxal phosphate-dependent protein